MLEHCEFFWRAFEEVIRVVKDDGFVFLIAPSAGPEHRYPVDCYRFYADAYHALAKYVTKFVNGTNKLYSSKSRTILCTVDTS